jgi:hypothetical protein
MQIFWRTKECLKYLDTKNKIAFNTSTKKIQVRFYEIKNEEFTGFFSRKFIE